MTRLTIRCIKDDYMGTGPDLWLTRGRRRIGARRTIQAHRSDEVRAGGSKRSRAMPRGVPERGKAPVAARERGLRLRT